MTHQREDGRADDGHDARLGTVSWPEYAALVLPLFVAVCAVLTKLLGAVLSRPAMVSVPLTVAGVVALTLGDPLRPRRSDRFTAQVFWLTAAQVVVIGAFVSTVGLGRVPRIGSSDFGSHGGIVTWIVHHAAMPSPTRWDSSVSAYPSAGHLFGAIISWITPLNPLESLWVATLVAVFGSWLVWCALARLVAPRAPWLAGASVLPFVFAAYRYTVGIVTYDFFFAQLVGQWLALAGVVRIVAELRRLHHETGAQGPSTPPRRSWRDISAPVTWTVLMLGGAVLAYPQASVLLAGAVGAVVLCGPLPRRVRRIAMSVSVLATVVFVAILSRTIYWNLDLLAGTPGDVPGIRSSDVGGPASIAAACLGAFLLLWQVRTRRWVVAVIGAASGPVAVLGAMFALRAGVPVRVAVSDYRITKNVFGLVPLGCVGAAVGTSFALDRLIGAADLHVSRRARRSTGHLLPLAAALAAVVMLTSIASPTAAVRRIYDPDLYRLGQSLPAGQRSSVGLVAPWTEVYVMRWVGIGAPLSTDFPAEYPRSERWRAWPKGSVQTDLLLVSGPFVRQYEQQPGVTVERRLGSAVLLRRDHG